MTTLTARWLRCARPLPHAALRLFCLPYAGAGAGVFHPWPAALAPDVEVVGVQLPGRENRIVEPAEIDLTELAAALAEAVAADGRPYALYGHSLGARLAFEVIRRLRRTGAPLPVRLYVGAARAPHLNASAMFDGLSRLSDDELVARVVAGGGVPGEVADEPELLELLLPTLRADFTWLDDYMYRPGAPLPVPITAFAGTLDRAVSTEQMTPWEQHTTAGFVLHHIDGGHFFLQDNLADLTALLAADLMMPGGERPDGERPATTRVELGGTGWSVWPDALLRTTGFPADGLDAFASPAAATAADDLLAGRGDAEAFDKALADAITAGARKICEIAADPLFREAVTWQNPGVLVALDGLLAGGPDATRNVRRRERERAVIRYWQRYCAKNETIGFFGPVCWIGISSDTDRALDVRTGPGLLRERRVSFESWAVTAYADQLAEDPRIRRWWPPALLPHLTLNGRHVLRPMQPPLPLTAPEAALLARCDGRTPANQAVTALDRPEDGYLLLQRLVERDLITWDAALPIGRDAEHALRERITTIGDPDLRHHALTGLDRLRAARDTVATAAGDPDTLKTALTALDTEFTTLTGTPPRRRDGQMYAGRTLCYEDTTRDLDVTIGATLLHDLAPPLAIILTTARWLTHAVDSACRDVLRDLYTELQEDTGAPVSLADLWYLAQGLLFTGGDNPFRTVADDFSRRWAELTSVPVGAESGTRVQLSAADLTETVARLFPAERPGWSTARLHSPDLQICAPDVDAVNRGDYQAVLGELHPAWPAFDSVLFSPFHPDPDRLRADLDFDLGPDRLRILYPEDYPRTTTRTGYGLVRPRDRQLGIDRARGADPDRLLPVTAVTVSDEDGTLIATAPDGHRWPLIEVFAEMLGMQLLDAFKLTVPAPHIPRITIDRLTIARETWRTTVAETGLAGITKERERYLATRAWQHRLNLPDQIFVKIGTEVKPCYTDLTSPHYVGALCTMFRTAGPDTSVVISEALPTPDQAWVPDHHGNRYFSELRLQITDPTPAGGAR
ncbi:alpha/beta fold hydrolase [Streptosporangium sp. NBC_01756]|uniref:alpha/beta fold hydrolase n=1 Tax=Streptosporangium sp. NBC_01756 TaxID=2975950 RepID=UPI002DDC5C68|nr:alpha/beta fold hydrolase [Streptosporangium sp. NBC_01756]WSC83767.1 alpha/beta fold hydrolase [Streptosporangium sp. NBC_01756]